MKFKNNSEIIHVLSARNTWLFYMYICIKSDINRHKFIQWRLFLFISEKWYSHAIIQMYLNLHVCVHTIDRWIIGSEEVDSFSPVLQGEEVDSFSPVLPVAWVFLRRGSVWVLTFWLPWLTQLSRSTPGPPESGRNSRSGMQESHDWMLKVSI